MWNGMGRKICIISLTVAMAMGMTACGNVIPNMTGEEMKAVSEYAAITLMKYDVSHRSRLVDLELVAQVEAQRKEQELLREQQKDAEGQGDAGMGPTEDTPVIDANGVPEVPPASMEEVLNLPEGVNITYREMEVCDSYPHGGEDFFSLSATEGNRLVVLKFDIQNGSGQGQAIDLLSQGANFKVTVNGNYTRRALTTMLPDDLVIYKDTIEAGESVETVVIVEVEGSVADNVSSLSLNLQNDSKTYVAQFL